MLFFHPFNSHAVKCYHLYLSRHYIKNLPAALDLEVPETQFQSYSISSEESAASGAHRKQTNKLTNKNLFRKTKYS